MCALPLFTNFFYLVELLLVWHSSFSFYDNLAGVFEIPWNTYGVTAVVQWYTLFTSYARISTTGSMNKCVPNATFQKHSKIQRKQFESIQDYISPMGNVCAFSMYSPLILRPHDNYTNDSNGNGNSNNNNNNNDNNNSNIGIQTITRKLTMLQILLEIRMKANKRHNTHSHMEMDRKKRQNFSLRKLTKNCR